MIPGARCWYDVVGVGHLQDDPAFVGTAFLLRVRTTALGIHGTQSELRSVGYRLLLQRRGRTGWRTTQRGPLKSGAASDATPVVLPGLAIRRNPKKSPDGGRYRAVLKLLWWDETAEVEGVEVGAIEYHRRTFDDPIGGACRARVPISG